jgi:predicted metal-dependent phosphoesterase TrpH
MKNVMKRAWEIAKEGVKKFGGKVKEYFATALKLAWKEAKRIAANEVGAIQLTGSEKQIKWAEDIRKVVIENIDSVFAVLDKSFEENKNELSERKLERAQKAIEELKKITNNFIENEENAGEWIEKFKGVTKKNANVKREIFKAIENEVENFDIRVARAVNDVFVTADIKFLKGEF